MNKLEQLQNQYGVNNVYLVATWYLAQRTYFHYYVVTTKEFHVGHSTCLDTTKMECTSILEGVNSGRLCEEEIRQALIKFYKSSALLQNSEDRWVLNFGRYLIGNYTKFIGFQFNLPVILEGGSQMILYSLYRGRNGIMACVYDGSDTSFDGIRASRIKQLVGSENIAEMFKDWRVKRIENASLKDLCNGVDVRVTKFIKTCLCK